METGIIALVSVALNALTAIFAPMIARRMGAQTQKIRKTEETLGLLGTGIRVIERAVEANKDELSRTGAGNRIAQTIREYGPAAKQLVDSARSAAVALHEEAQAVVEPQSKEARI